MKHYEMTKEQLDRLLEACKPVPYIVIGGVEPRTPQQNANEAWRQLGDEMGFDWKTVRPVPGAGPAHFIAEPKTKPDGEAKP